METIQLSLDEKVLKMFGEQKIREYLNQIVSMKKLEYFTDHFSKLLDIHEDDYQKLLEDIRQDTWEEYKKDLPI